MLLTAVSTAATTHDTQLRLYPPGGGALYSVSGGDQLDVALNASGTWTLLVEDAGLDTPGTYTVSYVNLTAGPLTSAGDPDGGPITSASIASGSISGVADIDAWSFFGTAGDRIVVAAIATSGALNTNISVYGPTGAGALVSTSSDRVDIQITATGTQTLVIQDLGNDAAGGYSLSYLNVTAGPLTTGGDPDGGPIASNEVRNAAHQTVPDFDAYTFNATNGDRVLLTAVSTAATTHDTQLRLYPPGGGALYSVSGGDQLDVALNASGTWTLLVEDAGLDTPGTYTVSYVNLTAGPLTSAGDPDGGPITSASIASGSISGVADIDAWSFFGTAGDRIVVAAIATSGALNTNISVYGPTGAGALVSTSSDRVDIQITATGTQTLVIQDLGNDAAGGYSLSYLNVTAGPLTTGGDPDGGPIASNEVRNAAHQTVPDFDAYTFTGVSGQRVLLTAVSTAATTHDTQLRLYPPGGGALYSVSGGDQLDVALNASGTWTLLVEDAGLDTPGTYTASYVNLTNGPYTSAGDLEGGSILAGQTRAGQMGSIADVDVYTFIASAGDTARVTCVTTSGSWNTNISLYRLDTGGLIFSTSADDAMAVLPTTGVYAIVVEDLGFDATGGYQLTLGAGLHTVDTPTAASTPPRLAFAPITPNPSRGAARLEFALPRRGTVRIELFDVRGARVRIVTAGEFEAGHHSVVWDGRDAQGRPAAAGMYFAELRAGAESARRSVVRVE